MSTNPADLRGRPDDERPLPCADGHGPEQSWQAAWAERGALLRLARGRSVSLADAEDAVSEAILRSQETGGVDVGRVGPWLNTVTARLCADDARDRARLPKRVAYQVRQGLMVDGHDEELCDRAEADWVARHIDELPPRQQQALRLRADGLAVDEIAAEMGVAYKAVEGLLQRARGHLKGVLASASVWAGVLLGAAVFLGRRRATSTGAAVLAATATALVLLPQHAPPPAAAPAPVPVIAVAQGQAKPDVAAPRARSAATTRAVVRPALERRVRTTAPVPAAAVPSAVTVRPSPEVLLAPRRLSAGPVTVEDEGVTRHDKDKTFLESTQTCLDKGPEVSTTFIGCRPEDSPKDEASRR